MHALTEPDQLIPVKNRRLNARFPPTPDLVEASDFGVVFGLVCRQN